MIDKTPRSASTRDKEARKKIGNYQARLIHQNHLRVINSDGLGKQSEGMKITKMLSVELDKVTNLSEQTNIQTLIFLVSQKENTKV